MLTLTAAEQAMAAGAAGPAAAMAMRILAEMAGLLGAPRLLPIASAHIDGCLYHGDAGVEFAERLVAGGGRVAVPATLNVGALDLLNPGRVRLDPPRASMARRLMDAYRALGCRPTWTCAPYQAGHRPALGQQIAWGESNAVAFANSVLGARTNRYGDFLDICCALTGRAPDCGLHRPDNRRATVLVDATGLSGRLRASEILYPVLGSWYGAALGETIAVIDGLAGHADEDRLKAFGAAAASAGPVALFHIAGVTPEAPDAATALGHQAPRETIRLTPDLLRAARDRLSTATGERIDAVAIGSPHLSLDECTALLAALGDEPLALPFYACTGRHVVRQLAEAGALARLERAGVTIVADTCVVVTPILAGFSGVLMTNSGKFAHYAPANTGYGVVYGSLADCVASARAGRLVRDETAWA